MTKIPKMNHDEEQHTLSNARRAVMMPSSPDVCHPILRNTSVTKPPKLQTKTADKHHNQWVTPAVPQKQYFTSLAQKLTSKPSGKSCLMLFSPFQIHRRKKLRKIPHSEKGQLRYTWRKRSLLPRSKKGLNWTAIFYLIAGRNGQWKQWDANWRHKKIELWLKKV